MKAIANMMLWAVALAFVFGTPADTFARYPIFAAGKTYCTCNCYVQGIGVEYFGWENVGTCTGANGKNCNFKRGGTTYTGKLQGCAVCKATQPGLCDYTAAVGAGAAVGQPADMAPARSPEQPTPKPPAKAK